MASIDELACVYSTLILQDDNVAITAEKLQTLLKAANVDIEPFWPGIFVKSVGSINLKDLVSNVGAGAGAPAAGGAAAPAAAEAAKEEKKEEKEEEEEEEDGDMGFSLFD